LEFNVGTTSGSSNVGPKFNLLPHFLEKVVVSSYTGLCDIDIVLKEISRKRKQSMGVRSLDLEAIAAFPTFLQRH
jgi:hypothetical protein